MKILPYSLISSCAFIKHFAIGQKFKYECKSGMQKLSESKNSYTRRVILILY